MIDYRALIEEADKLATLINIARLECRSLPDDATVRLVEVTNLLMDIRHDFVTECQNEACENAAADVFGVPGGRIFCVECDYLLENISEGQDNDDDIDDGIQCYINGRPVTNKEFADSYR